MRGWVQAIASVTHEDGTRKELSEVFDDKSHASDTSELRSQNEKNANVVAQIAIAQVREAFAICCRQAVYEDPRYERGQPQGCKEESEVYHDYCRRGDAGIGNEVHKRGEMTLKLLE